MSIIIEFPRDMYVQVRHSSINWPPKCGHSSESVDELVNDKEIIQNRTVRLNALYIDLPSRCIHASDKTTEAF